MKKLPLLSTELCKRIGSYFAGLYASGERFGGASFVETQRFGDAIAVKSKTMPWQNGVFGFDEASLDQLDDIVGFFGTEGAEFRFHIPPMSFTAVLSTRLIQMNFGPVSGAQAVTFGEPSAENHWRVEGVEIEEVTSQSVTEFSQAQVLGFGYPREWLESIRKRNASRLELAGAYLFIVRQGGMLAGSGMLIVRDGIGGLMDTAVIPEFRGKGLQAALLQHRAVVAKRVGCDLIVSAAQFGSASFRNQMRWGLQLAYTESVWSRRTG